jgi:chorismate-pyruvate lyase
MSLRREAFIDPQASPAEAACARRLLPLLLAQDGSTTRLCETIAGGPVALQLLHQAATDDVPALVREALPGRRFIERITSLAAHGEVMMDNLSYIALDGLDASLRRELEAGRTPIGHLLSRLWVRRETLAGADLLRERLWRAVGVPDGAATRAYLIVTPEGPRMLIVETYRRGMLMER